jgi:hypothetical protein
MVAGTCFSLTRWTGAGFAKGQRRYELAAANYVQLLIAQQQMQQT